MWFVRRAPDEKAVRRTDPYCIVERASLGRPAAKRARSSAVQSGGATTLADLDPLEKSCPELAKLGIKEYLFIQNMGGYSSSSSSEASPTPDQVLTEYEIFDAVMDPASLFSLIYSKDRAFGSSIIYAGSHQTRPLLDLVSRDLAKTLDACLVWHRFYSPQIPTLVDLRKRLTAEGHLANCATKMLFASLSLTALEMPEGPTKQYTNLKQSLRLSSLFLCDYKPTALATSQPVVHRAVKSQLYINVAYQVAERLRLLPEHLKQSLQALIVLDPYALECYIADLLQSIQVYTYHATLSGFAKKPLHAMRRVLSRIKPAIDLLQGILRHRQLSPRLIFQMQYVTGIYITMRSLADVKHNCLDPDQIAMIIENVEMECLEHTQFSSDLLAGSMVYSTQDEIYAAHSLLELRFYLTQIQTTGAGLFYTIIMRGRSEQGKVSPGEEPHLDYTDTTKLGDQVLNAYKPFDGRRALPDASARFTQRFGATWPWKLRDVLQLFLRCTQSLKLDGVAFHPPCRSIIIDILPMCKNIVENNSMVLKMVGVPRVNFDELRDLLRNCALQVGAMSVPPGISSDTAFVGGCVYAASSKLLNGMCDVMERVTNQFMEEQKQKDQSGMLQMPVNFDFTNGVGEPLHSDEWSLLPFVGASDFSMDFHNDFDWTSALHVFASSPSDFYSEDPLDVE
ncbi:hypothetical protein N7512_009226 [Penicillium capsulatum]|nr:hypothetical protein N7512_009226 [Penicillium capsulatum]